MKVYYNVMYFAMPGLLLCSRAASGREWSSSSDYITCTKSIKHSIYRL